MRKSILKTAGIIAIALFGLASCSSDDSNNGPGGGGSIDAAVGTFTGKLTIGNGPNAGQEFFNATIIITKVSGNQLKVEAKSGEAYSGVTAKTMKVYNNAGDIMADGNIPEGTIVYKKSSKSLTLLTKEQAASDIIFLYEGAKP
ncbi:hypothetical protein [Flavobacterium lindanitolerans]|uniref:hypothetical protein n=1 Tax=Flavobacterium lindanitolerans TaxID=428988 RepID=UPI0027B92E5B|nr:hypothetical protein [Flavobacterium lindanitolerans]